jgi:hypothetical protein
LKLDDGITITKAGFLMQALLNEEVVNKRAVHSLDREVLLERRSVNNRPEILWDDLTLAQKFAASSLLQFGYELSFIRNQLTSKLAILSCNGNLATITAEGDINTSPAVEIRL